MTKIHETRIRSILKGITGRALEVVLDTILMNIVGVDIKTSFVLALVIEGVCFVACFINERGWNLTDFGRVVKNG